MSGGTPRLETQLFNASTSNEIDAAFAALSSWRADAPLVGPDPFFNTERARLVGLAARNAVPASYHLHEFVEAGGLISYGPDLVDSMRQCGSYAGRILKGDKPADMAVIQPTKFEMLINLKTAKALGLTIAPFVLAQANEVIE